MWKAQCKLGFADWLLHGLLAWRARTWCVVSTPLREFRRMVSLPPVSPLDVQPPVRLASLPDVPTFAEAGLPGFSGGTWFGLLAPSATPAPLIAKINTAVVHVLHSAEMRSAFADRNILVGGDTPAEFGQFIQAELAKWKALANKIGIVAE